MEEAEMKENPRSLWRPVRLSKTLILLILALAPLGTAGGSLAQAAPPDQPLHFRFVGRFHDPQKDPNAGGVNSYAVTVEDKKWIFDIDKADALFGSAQGLSVIKKIYPPVMTFLGPKELTDLLRNPEIEGKSYTLQGYLYLSRRIFRLTEVQGPEQEAEAASDSQGGSGSAPPASSPPAAPTNPQSAP